VTEFGTFSGIASTISHGILGLPLNLHGDCEQVSALVDGDGTPGDFGQMFPESEASQVFLDGIGLGVGIGQMLYQPHREIAERCVPRMRWWNPRALRQDTNSRAFYLMTRDGEVEVKPGNGEWVLFTPYGAIDGVLNAPWIFATLAFVFARDAAFDRQRHSEVCSPVRVMRHEKPSTKQARQKNLRLLQQMQRDNRFVLPEGTIFEIVESTGKIAEIYQAIIDWAIKEWAIGWTGQTVTTDGGKGFITEGTIHQRIARDKLRFYAKVWYECLREQVLRGWAWENFGSCHPPTGGYNIDPPEDIAAKGTARSSWAQGIIQQSAAAKEIGGVLDPLWVVEDAQKHGVRILLPQRPAPPDAELAADDVPTPDHAAVLAAQMTAAGMTECEHARPNKCPLCGVERQRGVEAGPDGAPRFILAWRAIQQSTLASGAEVGP